LLKKVRDSWKVIIAAEPEVHTCDLVSLTAAPFKVQMNGADRSSEIVTTVDPGCLAKAKVSGAQVKPGERSRFVIPF